jgi:glutathione S-transferase
MNSLKVYALTAYRPELKGIIRDLRVMWLLEEIGAPYEVEYLDPRTDTKKPEFLAISPFGRVPAIRDGDFGLFESGAICLYLADKFGRFVPKAGTRERWTHDQWYFAALANFEFNAMRVLACDLFFEAGAETDAKRKNALENLEGFFPSMEEHLKKSPYLSGKEFQLCDLFFTSLVRYLGEKKYLEKYPALTAYLRRNTERPAFQRAFAKNGGK